MRRLIIIVCVSLSLWCCLRQCSKEVRYNNRPDPSAAQQGIVNDSCTSLGAVDDVVEGSILEHQVVQELNKCRSNPPQYAEDVLEPFLNIIHGNIFEFGGENIQLQEGRSAVEEAINVLKTTEVRSPLIWSDALYRMADDHCKTQGLTDHVGHERENGESFPETCLRFGVGTCGENIDYGYDDAKMIIIMLLVDDGVPSRGHRDNMLRPTYNRIGVACGPHKKYRHMCVLDFQVE